jgi:V/A-type H+-transporting ATPase subunit K
MDELLKWLGIIFPMALGACGSAIGCMIGGGALAGAMTRTKTGHGGLIAMSAAPSTQTIYGLVVMMSLKAKYAAILAGKAAAIPAGQFLSIGLLCGIAIMISAIVQGMVAASGIRASVDERSIFGRCWVAIGTTESFAVFSMVFGIMAIG